MTGEVPSGELSETVARGHWPEKKDGKELLGGKIRGRGFMFRCCCSAALWGVPGSEISKGQPWFGSCTATEFVLSIAGTFWV